MKDLKIKVTEKRLGDEIQMKAGNGSGDCSCSCSGGGCGDCGGGACQCGIASKK